MACHPAPSELQLPLKSSRESPFHPLTITSLMKAEKGNNHPSL